jgi:hypothetical protein
MVCRVAPLGRQTCAGTTHSLNVPAGSVPNVAGIVQFTSFACLSLSLIWLIWFVPPPCCLFGWLQIHIFLSVSLQCLDWNVVTTLVLRNEYRTVVTSHQVWLLPGFAITYWRGRVNYKVDGCFMCWNLGSLGFNATAASEDISTGHDKIQILQFKHCLNTVFKMRLCFCMLYVC